MPMTPRPALSLPETLQRVRPGARGRLGGRRVGKVGLALVPASPFSRRF